MSDKVQGSEKYPYKLNDKYKNLYVDAESPGQALERLAELVSILRKKCPWDREQTHESLRKCMIEEAYEACDAIDRKDAVNLKEELGDVLLQVVFHAEMADEKDEFDIKDVINTECEKMIRRHPHIFSQETAEEEGKTVDNVLIKWENVKSEEHGNTTYSQRLDDVPKALPALLRCEKVQKRAADAGFDWIDIEEPIAKVSEELGEFRQALLSDNCDHIQEELGDLFFATVNVARHAGFDSEETLNRATAKFIRRFKLLEAAISSEGLKIEDLDIEEMDVFWERIKKNSCY